MYKAWQAIGMDVTEWLIPNTKWKLKFLLIMDLATRLKSVHVLRCYEAFKMETESSADLIRGISERWLADKPKPQIVVPDNATTCVSKEIAEFLSNAGIHLAPPAEKASWAHGQIESAVKDVKMTASAIQLGDPAQDPVITLHLAVAAMNSTEYVKGYSPFQWCYGKDYSITDEDVRTFAALPDAADDDYARLVHRRQSAEEVARKTRALRVMSKLANSKVRQPIRTFLPMQLVMVWKKQWPHHVHQGRRGGGRPSVKPHWIGPGRVVFHEVLPHQHHTDERRHIVWVLLYNRLFRCSVHSVRPVTDLEQTEFEVNQKEDISRWRTLKDILPDREYVDMAGDEPLEDEIEQPDLPLQPDSKTIHMPRRRATGKTSLQPEDFKDVPRRYLREPPEEPPQSEPPDGHASDYEPESPLELAPPADVGAPVEPEPKRPRHGANEAGWRDYDLHWVEELEAAQEQECDLHAALMDSNDVMVMEIDLNLLSNRQRKDLVRNPVAFMVKKMRDSEVNLAKLPGEFKVLFNRAKTKEVSSFLKAAAVRKALNNEELVSALGSGRIMRARWVLTWKPEDLEEAKKLAITDPNSTFTKDGLRKAKARIVLLGFEHPDLCRPEFKTASPVQSMVGRHLLYLMACVRGWTLEGLDLATAFLQTQPTEADRDLWTRGVTELRAALGLGEDGIMKVMKNIYGSTTAPRGLWLDLHKRLASIGGTPLIGERCLWIQERDPAGHPRVIGLMGGHVDDFHRCGDDTSQEWMAVKEKINNLYDWGTAKRNSYRHAGTDVTANKNAKGQVEITVNQNYYIEGLADIEIKPDRMRNEFAELSGQEIQACRATLGSLQWLALQTQPQLAARCNLLVSELSHKKNMQVAIEIQQLVCEVRRENYELYFRKPDGVESWHDVVFVTFCDQAHTNRPKLDSTGGLLSVASGRPAVQGKVTFMAPLAWRAWKLQRKAISSNDAEVQACLEGEDMNFRLRVLWCELNGMSIKHDVIQNKVAWAEELARMVKGIVATDSRGGFDAVMYNESPLLGLSNTRAALQALQLREALVRAATELRWLASDYDLGDALTKKKAECRAGLIKFLKTGLWSVQFDRSFTSARRNHQQGQSAIRHVDAASGSKVEEDFGLVQFSELDMLDDESMCQLLIHSLWPFHEGPL